MRSNPTDSTTTTATEVLIVGAGPTGLTLACELARWGVAVRLIERRAAHHGESRGKTLQPRSMEVLHDLGLADRVLAEGQSHLVYRKYFEGAHAADSEPFAERRPTPEEPYDSTVFLGQARLEQLLRDRLADHGGTVELGAELAGFTQDADGVTARLADGRTIRATHLVGCDGGRSTVRRALGLAFEGRGEEEQAMVCGDVEAPGLSRDVWHQWFGPDGGLMLWPVPGTDSFQLQAAPERDPDGHPLPPSLAGFQRQFDRYARLSGIRLANPTWLSTWRVNVRMTNRLRVGRVLLAGDAAHVHPIAGGLGLNTGVQDAFNLGWKLALTIRHQAGPALLDSYEQERLPVAADTLRITSEGLARSVAAVRRPGNGVETALAPPVGLHYRWSPLAAGRADGPLAPGDRAPDGRCRDLLCREVRLFDLFAGPHFTLLSFGCPPPPLGPHTPVVDTHALTAPAPRAYGLGERGGLVLVRPDNHVALLAEAADGESVRAYLDGLLGHQEEAGRT
ncbi:FAD-dependent monooxygenase [Kitasatospora viridis]|uniref:2-polyprenyl-6-methoxyphenol hydroxylase-like FAD-dependent oxidoreductase n=1 Tax=Kitasatospora viridis TaxID=281105 RepID=A0A561S9D2_9ACTN|nr:FAD-dependent monooxygenase [Kitasatospora viridis]TWF71471.1 2-polyprenyl-6-methoxyphenol hydroxylase-like FAD-dependent oxidoreductase [Kitasatospora viridis]